MEYDPITTASPKGPATGGGKAWSEEEETYLLQKRSEKVAYKKIAVQLNKTELACRLHFHQLQRGSNRRRRNMSMSSSESAGSLYATANYAASSYDDIHRRSASPGGSPPVPEMPYRGRSSHSPGHARQSSWASSPAGFVHRQLDNPADIDYSRLQRLVDHHKRNMWAAIAADYGEGAMPEFLETFWNRQQALRQDYKRKATTPPTPMVSPRTEAEEIAAGRGLSPSQTPRSHPLNQHPRKVAREGCRPWELETPGSSEQKRYEIFGPELHGGNRGVRHHSALPLGAAAVGGTFTELMRYSPERSTSNRSSHSSHRSISVESIIAPPEAVMTRV